MVDDDLLTPTLTDADDAVDFDRPWNPWSLVVLTFFFGLLAGGPLLALNYERLGIRRRFWVTAAVVGVFGVGLIALYAWIIYAHPALDTVEGRRWVRWGKQAVETLIAMGIAQPQLRRWRLFHASGLQGGNLLWWGVAAVLAATITQFLLGLFFVMLFAGLKI
jgi:hypothetical protein